MQGLDGIIERLIEERVASTVAVGVTAFAEGMWVRSTRGATDAYFDLASVTKPMTALAVALSGLDVRTPLGDLVEEARRTPSEKIPLELFLAHRAGLEAHLPLFAPLVSGGTVDVAASLRATAEARRPDAAGEPGPDGFAPLYSDLGYLLAGVALSRFLRARDAGEAIEELVARAWGLAGSLGTARSLAGEPGFVEKVAVTEDVPWRGGVLRGVVHDENAWAMTGLGGSGHAGMFGTVDAVLAFAQKANDLLERGAFPWMIRPRPGGTLLAGWDKKSECGSSAGPSMGAGTYGHLGFTGTSLWIDPDARIAVSLLTNRVHPTRDNVAIRAARPRVHDALYVHGRVLQSKTATRTP